MINKSLPWLYETDRTDKDLGRELGGSPWAKLEETKEKNENRRNENKK